jgi:uncharacterized protein
VGDVALVHDPVTANLDASGFDRDTFLCGQSGMRKTYSLGAVLERLLLDTDQRITVIAQLRLRAPRHPRTGADSALAAGLADLPPRIRVQRPSADPTERRLRLRFDELTEAARGCGCGCGSTRSRTRTASPPCVRHSMATRGWPR